MKKALERSVIIAIAVLSLTACSELMSDGRISEGLIEYEVTYPKLEEGSVLAELLPTKMLMKFKDDRFISELSAGFGMFKMNIVSDTEDREFWQLVKLINERFKVSYNEEKAANSLRNFPAVSIRETGKTKFIAEMECMEAVVTIQGDSAESFTIYYTDKIRLEKPNWFTQFSGIEGVLMEYQVERYNICTRFSAVQVSKQEIADEELDVPEDYQEIAEHEMDEKLINIFNSFSE